MARTLVTGNILRSGSIPTTALGGGVVTSSLQIVASLPTGSLSSSAQVNYPDISNIPGGIASSSAQIKDYLPTGTVSSSTQLPSGIASSSAQVTAYLPTGTVSSSGQISVFNTINGDQLATTGSNTFTAPQTISDTTNSTSYLDGALHIVGGMSVRKDVRVSGSMTINGLLTAVSMSTQYVTSSQYNVGVSRITLNDDDTVRFAGLSIYDSGSSSPTSASIFWDSLQHRFIYENLSGSAYNSSIIIAGPKHTGSLGDEPTLTSGYIPVATGTDHIDNSVMFQSGSNIGIGTANPSSKLEVSNSNITISSLGSSTNSTFKGVSINTTDLGGSTGNAGVYLSAPYGGGTTNQAFFRVKRGASDTYNGSEIAFSNKFRFLGSTTEDTNERLRIDEYGNISFGGAVPAEKLDFGDSTAAIRMKTGNSAQYITSLFDSYDYFSIANNYRRTGASAGTIGNSGLGTAEILFTNLGANAATIKFLVGNTNTAPSTKMTITTSGNVGIGVDSPDQRLHVSGSGTVVGHIQSSGTYSILRLTNSSRSSDIGTDSTGLYMDAGGAFPIAFYAGSSERMRITSAGNVGIGTTNPSYTLDVNGLSAASRFVPKTATTSSFEGAITTTGDAVVYNILAGPANGPTVRAKWSSATADRYLEFGQTDNGGIYLPLMRLVEGNTGIGTTTPSAKLHVFGSGGSFNSTIYGHSTNADMGLSLYSENNSGTPSIRLMNGLYSHRIWLAGDGSGKLHFATDWANTTPAVTFDGTNTAVGIGTTIPTGSLDVRGNNTYFGINGNDNRIYIRGYNNAITAFASNAGVSSNYNGLRIDSNVNNNNSLSNWFMDVGGQDNITRPGTTDTFNIGRVPSGGSSSTYFLINSSGNVGIGTSNPTQLLQVQGSTVTYTGGVRIALHNTVDGQQWHFVNGGVTQGLGNFSIRDGSAGANRITILSGSGNVGIGATDPGSYKLRVNGTARIESGLDLGGGLGAGMANAHTKTLSGNYSSGTWYELAGKSDLDSGVFIVVAYVDTYSAGSAIYYMYFASVPFFFTDINSNGPDSAQLPVLIGTGHAQNGVSPPDIRVRQTYSDAGIFVEFRPNATWTGLDGTAGKNVTFYVKRIA